MNRIYQLLGLGQSAWLDFLDRPLLLSGELRRMIERDGLRGVTSNPTIFQKAIASSGEYDALIRSAPPSETATSVLERLMVRDLTLACDELRPVYEVSGGTDGFASIEISPALARSTEGSIDQARKLWRDVNRPNLMVKIPGTPDGLPAIERCLADGININITLLFSVRRYMEVAEAYLRALETRIARGSSVDRIASVASFFVSRVDAKVDKAIDALEGAHRAAGRALRGKIAIANSKVAYEEFDRIIASDRWRKLVSNGAQPQRLLWASTSPKDPAYPDLHYVDALIAPQSIDTMTRESVRAFLDHGSPHVRLTADREQAHEHIDALAPLGIDFPRIAAQLEDEGVASFAESFNHALQAISEKRRTFAQQPHP